ncbi:MAG: class I SAM-dependent methyltransferase [bacterium]|nr:class I SAM-dependent methyltransferase [bacterium]
MQTKNTYDDCAMADAYSKLEFANTYYLAYRDIPGIIQQHVTGNYALDFGCGAGRSTRFLRRQGLQTIGVDIAEGMLSKAKEVEPTGDFRLVENGDLSLIRELRFDAILSAFTFDNIPLRKTKQALFTQLSELLKTNGRMINLVSSPEIYLHEWASFSTKDFPENHSAAAGDRVKIINTDIADSRPVDDTVCTHEDYQELYGMAGLEIVEVYRPLATGAEPYHWVNETRIPPWVIYVLKTKQEQAN